MIPAGAPPALSALCRVLRADYQPGRQAGQAFLRRFTIDLQSPDGERTGGVSGRVPLCVADLPLGPGLAAKTLLHFCAAAGSELPAWQPLVADEAQRSPPFDFPKTSPLYRGKPYRQAAFPRLVASAACLLLVWAHAGQAKHLAPNRP